MEHRWSDRIPSSIEVLLFHNNIPVVTCKAGNISHYGMFVKTGPVRYERNSQLEVEFIFNTKGRKKRFRIPAYVIHQSREGLGLMFSDDSQDTIHYIKGVIQDMSLAEPDEKYPVKRKLSSGLSSGLSSVSNKVIRDAGVG
jgi:hypothetical protein